MIPFPSFTNIVLWVSGVSNLAHLKLSSQRLPCRNFCHQNRTWCSLVQAGHVAGLYPATDYVLKQDSLLSLSLRSFANESGRLQVELCRHAENSATALHAAEWSQLYEMYKHSHTTQVSSIQHASTQLSPRHDEAAARGSHQATRRISVHQAVRLKVLDTQIVKIPF